MVFEDSKTQQLCLIEVKVCGLKQPILERSSSPMLQQAKPEAAWLAAPGFILTSF